MCGIVGLFLKDKALEPELGGLVAEMLATMSDRGPDSAGFAVYGDSQPDRIKLTLRGASRSALEPLIQKLAITAGTPIAPVLRDTHVTILVPTAREQTVRDEIAASAPDVTVVGAGRRMEIFKEVGRPDTVASRFDLARMSGTHAIGHTRMATESAVTTNGAHPFTTGADQCRPVPGAQRLAVEPQRGAAYAGARGPHLRDGQRQRGGGGLSHLAHA
jgi:glutamate synthase domain-containing protein 1